MADSEYTSRGPLEGTGGAVPVLLRMIPAGNASVHPAYHFYPWSAIDRGQDGQEWGLPPCVPPIHNSTKQNVDLWHELENLSSFFP